MAALARGVWAPERLGAWYAPEANGTTIGDENHAELTAAVAHPEVVRAMLEDYRAALTIDHVHEQADHAAHQRITAPLLVLWSLHDDLQDLYGGPVSIWRTWADDVRGYGIDSGHHVAEDRPEEPVEAVSGFFSERSDARR